MKSKITFYNDYKVHKGMIVFSMSQNKTDIPSIKNKAEWFYIQKRKLKAFFNSLCFYVCRIFPVRNNLISVCTFEGKGGFGCNPKYIVEELHKRNPDYEFVWFVNDLNKEFPDYIKKVPNTLWSRAYWLSRSRVWIDNYRKPYGTVKRKGQFYLNTWHGMIGFKSIGLWRGNSFSRMAYLVSKNDSDMVDFFLSDSAFCTQYFPKGLVYSGSYLEAGSPRCDILINEREEKRKTFYKKHNLKDNSHCVMFAPTFRETSQNGKRSVFSELWGIDFERLINNLIRKFGGEWYLCLRLHPQLAEANGSFENERVIDVSKESDLYEILAAMDALVTDYSSCAMDAEIMHIPIFIYADDIAEYENDRGSFTWEIHSNSRSDIPINKDAFPNIEAELPFNISKNNDELEEDILNFDYQEYEEKLMKYERAVGLIADGNASEKVAKMIMAQTGGERER